MANVKLVSDFDGRPFDADAQTLQQVGALACHEHVKCDINLNDAGTDGELRITVKTTPEIIAAFGVDEAKEEVDIRFTTAAGRALLNDEDIAYVRAVVVRAYYVADKDRLAAFCKTFYKNEEQPQAHPYDGLADALRILGNNEFVRTATPKQIALYTLLCLTEDGLLDEICPKFQSYLKREAGLALNDLAEIDQDTHTRMMNAITEMVAKARQEDPTVGDDNTLPGLCSVLPVRVFSHATPDNHGWLVTDKTRSGDVTPYVPGNVAHHAQARLGSLQL
ncbi:MAG: hypothetical protein FWD61_03430 [Phycisphaerales bacterium]|nr:hypothetical protein [Phycisphaerales bacterium]